MELKIIAYARNGHTDKFGIPRQSRDESPIITRIVLEPQYSVPEALRGIDEYSHLWLLWGFSEVLDASRQTSSSSEGSSAACAQRLDWSPTVRPPRLGGNARVGVFATRSPFRPNPIGLTCVKLVEVKMDDRKRIELIVSGADLMDGTPIYDIKPYLSFADAYPGAQNGFAEETKDYCLEVNWDDCNAEQNLDKTSIKPRKKEVAILDVPQGIKNDMDYLLSQDPRPAYQKDPLREYKLDYAGYRVTFTVQDGELRVKKLEKIQYANNWQK